MSKDLVLKYSPRYKEIVFSVWYNNERPNISKLIGLIPADESDRKPTANLIAKWIEDGEWSIRADILDEQASTGLDKELIATRIEVFKKHAEIGQTLQEYGLKYFEEHELKNEAIALKAILDGARLERESMGLGMALTKIFSMGDNDIQKEIQKLLNKSEKADVIDGEAKDLDDKEVTE